MDILIRAIFSAVKIESAVAPFDTAQLKIYYPAKFSNTEVERMTGNIPANAEHAPYPVVIFFNGINVGSESYRWLCVKLAEQNLIVVTFSWVSETLPKVYGITPGIDLAKVKPDTYGTGATASALPFIMKELITLNGEGLLKGMLDLKKIILGGHSAGGTVALQNANPKYFEGVVAAFSYAGHTMASTMLGFPPQTILPISNDVAHLIIGGTRDGVIAASGIRYGKGETGAATPIEKTFHEAIKGGRGDSYLIIIEGANHFSVAHPQDATTGRAFLEESSAAPEEERALIAQLISLFIEAHVRGSHQASQTLSDQHRHALIAKFHCK
jgi:predicted dienelactone hydrolase